MSNCMTRSIPASLLSWGLHIYFIKHKDIINILTQSSFHTSILPFRLANGAEVEGVRVTADTATAHREVAGLVQVKRARE